MRRAVERDAVETQRVAIIGMGCRLPGARTVQELWELLVEGRDAVGVYPGNRFPKVDEFLAAAAKSPENAAMAAGGFLEDLDQFDARAFELSPREAMYLDPQQRLLLEVMWAALEDAGQPRQAAKNRQTGVFVGLWASDFENILYGTGADLDFYAMTGSGGYSASGRLSFTFGFEGPSLTVDAACSSSLVAVHLACQSLLAGECTMAVAGGANAILATESTGMFTRAGMLSPDGRCKFGAANADGFVRSEGAGIVVLKRLSDAVAAGDPIQAVIRGSAVSNDGRTSGTLMTPSREGQRQTLHRAWTASGVRGGEIRYFEAHGTGTSVGDPVEVGAIGDALRDDGATQPCWIGSIKSNIGHTESAAGIAGLIKTVLALKNRMVPRSLLSGPVNPKIAWESTPLRLATEPVDLSGEDGPVIAGVSSFALTGTNSHLVVQEYRAEPAVAAAARDYLIPLSAHTEGALDALLREYETFQSDRDLRDVAYMAAVRRSHDGHRAAFVCADFAQLNESVALARLGGVFAGASAIRDIKRRVVFIAPGQGSQWAGMARELFAEEPVFRQMIQRCDAAIRVETGWSLIEVLLGSGTEDALREIDVVQPALFALSVSLAELWRSWGIMPDAVIGHSMGEVAAAHIAGVLNLKDAAAVICRRSRLMKTIRGSGAMLTVELPAKAVEELLKQTEGEVSIGASNSFESTVISGDAEAIGRLERNFAEKEIFCRRIKVDVASHSSQVDPILDDLREALRGIEPRASGIPMLSTVTAEYVTGSEMDAGYWVKNLRRPVRYAEGIEALATDGYDVFVELSPHPVLMPGTEAMLRRVSEGAVAVASTRREKPERREMLAALGTLYRYGCEAAWEKFYPEPARCAALPAYPFQRERYWPDLEELSVGASRRAAHAGPSLPGRRFEAATQAGTVYWEIPIDLEAQSYLRDHRVHGTIVMPAAAQVELVLEAIRAEQPEAEIALCGLRFDAAIQIAEETARELQLALRRDGESGYAFDLYGRTDVQGDWTRFLSGSAELGHPDAKRATMDISWRDDGVARHLDRREHYRIRTKAGIGYGPAFQLVEEAWSRDGESLVRIQRPNESQRDARARYVLHPALLDNCFQALQLAIPNGDGFLFDDTSLPVGIERFEMYWELPADGDIYCLARVTHSDVEQGTLRGDLYLSDLDGVVLGVVEGFEVRRVSGDLDARSQELLTEVAWEPLVMRFDAAPARTSVALIFCDARGAGMVLAKQLEAAGGRTIVVRPGARFNLDDGSEGGHTIDPGRREDVAKLLTEVAASGAVVTDVVHLWSLDASETDASLESMMAAQAAGAYFLPWLIQAIGECNLSEPPRLWVITSGAAAVGGETSLVRLAGAPTWGIGAVAAIEHPELRVSLVDLSADAGHEGIAGRDEMELLYRLMEASPDEDRIAIRGERVFVARFVASARAAKPAVRCATESAQLFRKDATYLISGGMGGVGSTVAGWMAANGAGCLVLISRREESDETRAILNRLEGLGARAIHARTDIVDKEAVGQLLARVRRDMPPIAGTMHAATVIDDALIADLSPERFEAVMGPKVAGTWNLYHATAKDDPEFMVLFSSIASVYPQPGHGSYAAANAFMDSFAHSARGAGGRGVTSINWGGWEQIGLARETGTGRSISGYSKQGFATMTGQRALSALKRAMETGVTQAIASPIDLEQAAEFFGAGRVPPAMRGLLAQVNAVSGGEVEIQQRLAATTSFDELIEELQQYLIGELGRVLKLAPERIGGETLFGSIGLDSLMTLEFVRRLRAGLGMAIPAATVFNHPTATLLARDIARRLRPTAAVSGSSEEGQQVQDAGIEVQTAAKELVFYEMSDGEALEALMQPIGKG